jgi:hypothetical protein
MGKQHVVGEQMEQYCISAGCQSGCCNKQHDASVCTKHKPRNSSNPSGTTALRATSAMC